MHHSITIYLFLISSFSNRFSITSGDTRKAFATCLGLPGFVRADSYDRLYIPTRVEIAEDLQEFRL